MKDDVFAVIADPTRRHILQSLAVEKLAVGELVEELGVSQPTVSKHLKVLRTAGLVKTQAVGQKRFYSLTPQPLQKVVEWVSSLQETPAAPAPVVAPVTPQVSPAERPLALVQPATLPSQREETQEAPGQDEEPVSEALGVQLQSNEGAQPTEDESIPLAPEGNEPLELASPAQELAEPAEEDEDLLIVEQMTGDVPPEAAAEETAQPAAITFTPFTPFTPAPFSAPVVGSAPAIGEEPVEALEAATAEAEGESPETGLDAAEAREERAPAQEGLQALAEEAPAEESLEEDAPEDESLENETEEFNVADQVEQLTQKLRSDAEEKQPQAAEDTFEVAPALPSAPGYRTPGEPSVQEGDETEERGIFAKLTRWSRRNSR